MILINDKESRMRIAKDMIQILPNKTGIDRRPDRARRHGSKPGYQHFYSAVHETAYNVARTNPEFHEIYSKSLGQKAQLAITQEVPIDLDTILGQS